MDRPRWEELRLLDEPGSATDIGATGEDRGQSEEELVEKPASNRPPITVEPHSERTT
jgi:hypothetical protein